MTDGRRTYDMTDGKKYENKAKKGGKPKIKTDIFLRLISRN